MKTKNKKKRNSLFFCLRSFTIVLLITFFVSSNLRSSNPFLTSLANQKEQKEVEANLELLYLHSNGSTFKVGGDTIWFKAYNCTAKDLKPSELSQFLNVSLLNSEGEQLLTQKHKFQNGQTHGDLIIPDSLKIGYYTLAAYSNLFNGNNPGHVFFKRIKLTGENEVRLKLILKDSLFNTKDKLEGSIEALGLNGVRLGKVRIQMQLIQGDVVLEKLNFNISEEGVSDFSIPIPKLVSKKALLLQSTIKHSQLVGSSTMYIPLKQLPPEIQFFPEGGEVITKTSTNIAFKAIDAIGNPFDFTGEILDRDGLVVDSISSHILGMGQIDLNYKDSLYLKILHPVGYDQKYKLPQPIDSGYVFKASQSLKDQLIISVSSNFKKPETSHTLTLRIRDEICFSKTLALNELNAYAIPTKNFPMGVAQITLFDEEGIPKAERLIFLNQDHGSKIKINRLQKTYKSKDLVKTEIELQNHLGKPASGNLSMSVVKLDANYVADWEENIMSTFLLKPELKGEIICPGFYFSDHPDAKKAIDFLMLTQGWRRFKPEGKQPIEQLATKGISGKVVKLNGRPAKNTSLVLFNAENYGALNANTDKAGKFSINGKGFSEVANAKSLVLSATGPGGNTNLKILMEQDNLKLRNSEISFAGLSSHARKNYYFAQKNKSQPNKEMDALPDFEKESVLLTGVTIKARKKVIIPEEVYTKKFASRKLETEDLEYSTAGGEVFLDMLRKAAGHFFFDRDKGQLLFRGFNHIYYNRQQGAAFVVDEQFKGFTISTVGVEPSDIESIEVFKSSTAALKYTQSGFGGLIKITTKKGFSKKEMSDFKNKKAENIETIPGFEISREFYSPVYPTNGQKKAKLDLRHTLYWETNLVLFQNRKQYIKFFNSDIKGKFLIRIEGINEQGQIGFNSRIYSVKDN